MWDSLPTISPVAWRHCLAKLTRTSSEAAWACALASLPTNPPESLWSSSKVMTYLT